MCLQIFGLNRNSIFHQKYQFKTYVKTMYTLHKSYYIGIFSCIQHNIIYGLIFCIIRNGSGSLKVCKTTTPVTIFRSRRAGVGLRKKTLGFTVVYTATWLLLYGFLYMSETVLPDCDLKLD